MDRYYDGNHRSIILNNVFKLYKWMQKIKNRVEKAAKY